MSTQTGTDYDRDVDRLYALEREERNERRSLEQRAVATLAGSVAASGFLLAGASNAGALDAWAVWPVIAGLVLMVLGTVSIAFVLGNQHVPLDERRGTTRTSTCRCHTPRPLLAPPTDESGFRKKFEDEIRDMRTTNKRTVTALRRVSLTIGGGFYIALAGVLAFLALSI